MKNPFSGRGQTWLGVAIAVAAMWLPVILADPWPATRRDWVYRIVASLGVLNAAIGRALGQSPEEKA